MGEGWVGRIEKQQTTVQVNRGGHHIINYTDTKALVSFLLKLPINVGTCCLYGAGRNDFLTFMRENPRGPLKGVGPENRGLLGP